MIKMEEKTIKLTAGMFVLLVLTGLVFAEIRDKEINLEKEKVDALALIGIISPEISSCIKIDDYTCKANIYEKGGINKDIILTYKFCDVYVLKEQDTNCLTYEQIKIQGECLLFENETCLEYETLYENGECLLYDKELVQTSKCKTWKTLTPEELETEIITQTEILLNRITNIHIKRNTPKVDEAISEVIEVIIKEVKK